MGIAPGSVDGGTEAAAASLREIFAGLLGLQPADIGARTSFLELGAESLLLMQATQAIADRLGVTISFRDLLGQYTNVATLAEHVVSQGGGPAEEPRRAFEKPVPLAGEDRPPAVERVQVEPPAPLHRRVAPASPSLARSEAAQFPPADDSARRSALELARMQLDLMMKQLEILADGRKRSVEGAPAPEPEVPAPSPVGASPTAAPAGSNGEVYIPYEPIRSADLAADSSGHEAHIARLVAEIEASTAGSKRLAERHRRAHADSRMSAGFQLPWKEIVYPIVADRAHGGRFVDVDGNDYVDITMDYGVNLFGHTPEFVNRAIEEQLARGMPIGPQAQLSGPVAELICELTGVERVAFLNSGTEAVMGAMRLARTVTHRPTIAIFSGCYHGGFDGVLGRTPEDGSADGRVAPLAPGVPPSMVGDLLIADYADPRALDVLAAHADELAAVLVEPVQSRRPQLQPVDWLHELRAFTRRAGAALIFDEVITGFRLHPGGAQAWSGIRADLVTYGKVIGGGMPIGVIAGNSDLMAAIDGGLWDYGDDSWPSAETTLFAGTFWKHPLVLAAASAILTRLRDEGPALQERLNEQTSKLVGTLNAWFESEGVPIGMVSFASLFRFVFGPGVRYRDIFFYHLLARGVYVWEGRTCFLSTAHTDEDLKSVVEAVKASVEAMRSDGLIPIAASEAVAVGAAGEA